MATSLEINSFVSKFKFLLANGFKATLTISAEHGQAVVNLNACVGSLNSIQENGNHIFRTPQQHGRPRNQAYFRRQEKRRVLRQNNSVAEEATIESNSGSSSRVIDDVAEQVTANSKNDENKTERVMVSKVSSHPVKLPTVEMVASGTQVKDFTTITFGYWDGYYTSTANDAGKHVIDKLQKSFRDNEIDECDQVAILSQVTPVDNHIASLEPNEFKVKVKVKKDLPKMLHCARSICSAPPLGITLKSFG